MKQIIENHLMIRPNVWIVCLSIASLVAAIPTVRSAPVTEDSLAVSDDLGTTIPTTTTTASSASEILISALDDENFGRFTGNRLRYDQATTEPTSSLGQSAAKKPEPRNNADEEHQQQQDQLIIDHRPTVGAEVATTQGPPATTSTTTQQSVGQQIASSSQQQSLPVPSAWNQAQVQSQQQQQQQQQQQLYQPIQFGQMSMAPSSQVATIQHPTSINSIINDHQNQQQQQYQVAASASNQLMSSASQQPQLVAVQGQAGGAPVILLNAQPGILPGGRRISISGWLKGFSNMLANIFNRRDQHANQLMQPTAAASTPSSHWIQLGPNAPHWLTQAQSALQQFQQGTSQFGNSPANSMLASASGNRFTFLASPASVGPQQSSSISLAMQPQSAQMIPSTATYLAGDLQASGSAPQQTIMSRSVAVPAPQAQQQQPQYQTIQTQLVAPQQQQHQQQVTVLAAPSGQQSAVRLQPGNTQQVIAATTSAAPANHQPVHRSGRSPPSSSLQQTATATSTSSPIQSTTTTSTLTTPATSSSSQTFPLAHYGRYSD